MADQKIVPCPDCGFDIDEISYTNKIHYWVECDVCGMQGPLKDTEAEAIAAHNKVSRNSAAGPDMRADDGLFDAVEELFRLDDSPAPEPGNHHFCPPMDPLFQAYIGALEAIDNE